MLYRMDAGRKGPSFWSLQLLYNFLKRKIIPLLKAGLIFRQRQGHTDGIIASNKWELVYRLLFSNKLSEVFPVAKWPVQQKAILNVQHSTGLGLITVVAVASATLMNNSLPVRTNKLHPLIDVQLTLTKDILS